MQQAPTATDIANIAKSHPYNTPIKLPPKIKPTPAAILTNIGPGSAFAMATILL